MFGLRVGSGRRVVLLLVMSLALLVAVPPADVLPAQADRLPLSWLWRWLPAPGGWASPVMPPTPRQESAGTAAGRAHLVPAAVTRAGRGSGHAPGRGAGELPA